MPAPVAHEVRGGTGTNVASFNITAFQTAQTDYILLLVVYNEHTGTAAATVSSVSSSVGGMTWALRRRSNSSTTGGLEVWWAHGTSTALYNITINMTGAYDDAAAEVVAISGCANSAAPFDTNAALPHALSAPTPTWTPSHTGISTSSTDNLLLFVSGSVAGADTPASGFTQVFKASNPGGAWSCSAWLETQSVTALQTNATFTRVSAMTSNGAPTSGESIFDALAGNLPAGGGAQARAMVLA